MTTGPARWRARVVALALLAAVGGLVVLPAPGAAATAYRYWSYWTGGPAGWTFAVQGASRVPADGAVEGWRFAVSQATGSSTPPAASADFEAVCGGTPPVEGAKRVAVVVDPGTTADAPEGDAPWPGPVVACVRADARANGYQLLVAALGQAGLDDRLRLESGLVCGVAGYPERGCGEPVAPGGGATGAPDDRGDVGGGPDPDESTGGSPSASATDGRSSPREGAAAPTPTGSDAGAPSPSGDAASRATAAASVGTTPGAAAAAVTTSTATAGGPPVSLLVGVAGLAVLALAAAAAARRRR